jgi:hypothetical protein
MRRGAAVLLLLAATSAWGGPSTKETLKRDVQRALTFRTPSERASAVQHAFDGQDSADAAAVAVEEVFGEDEAQTVLEAAMLAVARMKSPAVVGALRKGADAPPTLRRIRSIEALGRSQAVGAPGSLFPLLGDSDAVIRAAAATAIGRNGDASVVGNVEAMLDDPAWTVRSAAISALTRIGSTRSILAIAAAMRKSEGRLVDDCRIALTALSGQQLGPNPGGYEAWWWEKQEKKPENAAIPFAAPRFSFQSHKLGTRSRRLLFVLSTSETMKETVGDAAGDPKVVASIAEAGQDLAADLKAAKTKLDVARVHLRAMLRTLRDDVSFDVMAYAASPSFAFGKLTAADASSRKRAEARIAGLSPSGAGNLHGALVRAFDPKGKDPYAVEDGPDTIVLFTDGAMSAPGATDATEVAGAVARWEAVRQIRMYVFETGQADDSVLGRLAAGPPEGAAMSLP